MPRVNADILRWARETAGFTPEQAVKKLNLAPARGRSALQRLHALETGEEQPTRAQLVTMASQYRRPLVTFYMSSAPRRGDRGQDFRTLPSDHSLEEDALLDALIRDVRARQSLVRAVLEDEDEAEPVPFVGSRRVADGIAALVGAIQQSLGVTHQDLYKQPSSGEAFNLLRARTEQAGVFVLLAGNLGSHHSALELETFRGLVLADDIAPFIVINDRDAKTAWSFTLLHELTHLYLGQSGVSGADSRLEIEQFCNQVASEFLLPASVLDALRIGGRGTDEIAEHIDAFAGPRNIGSSMVAYRLWLAGLIRRPRWTALTKRFRDRWIEEDTRRRQNARERAGGPSFYVVRSHRIGDGLLRLVQRMHAAGALTTTRAGKILGVRPKLVEPLLSQASRRRMVRRS